MNAVRSNCLRSVILACLSVSIPATLAGCDGEGDPGTGPLDGPATLLWTQPMGGRVDGPFTDGKRVYNSGPGGVWALDARTGEFLWEFDGRDVGFAHPSFVVAGDLVVVSWRGVLRGIRAGDGTELWATGEAPTEWTGVPGEGNPSAGLASDGATAIYVGADEKLARIDPSTGGILWSRPVEGDGAFAFAAGSGVVCSRRSPIVTVACHSGEDGHPLWSIGQLSISPRGGIAVVGSRVVVAADGWHGLDLATGSEMWQRIGATPSLARGSDQANDIIYACGGFCVAIRAQDGSELWRAEIDNTSPPEATERFLFVNAFDVEGPVSVHVLDASSGQLLDEIEAESGFRGRLAYGDGRLFGRIEEELRAYRYP